MRSLSCLAAMRVAARLGYPAEDPLVLQETNNTVVWLRPHAIIAKVGKWTHSEETLVREHAVARVLAADDAPVAVPLADVVPIRDVETGLTVTLGQRLDDDATCEATPVELGTSLRELHMCLTRYARTLPSFQHGLNLARAALGDDGKMRALRDPDRVLLRDAFDRLRAELDAHVYVEQPLHGEPHAGNVLVTAAGLRWIDLEAVCLGPLEWDLAFLPTEAVAVFPNVDDDLLRLLRVLNSARVATWCWLLADIDEMRRGEYHLERVRIGRAQG